MAAGRINFIWVGKLKKKFYADGCAHYHKKLSRFYKLDERVVRDGPGKLPAPERNAKEGEGILAKAGKNDLLVVLDEHGEQTMSRGFAKLLTRWTDMPGVEPTFVIGGPFGLSDEVKAAARHTMRLSDMTLPHELARLMLMEQLYRAACIQKGIPYHHD
ncbi:23S rRNA (pseudouridine(1915)-N(3))-methyltransferase RlmH [Desulfovibrio oxyclinae]|uniref:23S rRNA (pseudouridine(1915)-N(3))-methyltransferase RlmH n=1 Tax=Desulfovibrio oxyclinae TaxID=63560 RepID=UPI0003605B5F|nr:23S rRNA (pseudouridine(1915)-N(3))-methyltransferase RlmH [Desulfovibrio oxyclinae]